MSLATNAVKLGTMEVGPVPDTALLVISTYVQSMEVLIHDVRSVISLLNS